MMEKRNACSCARTVEVAAADGTTAVAGRRVARSLEWKSKANGTRTSFQGPTQRSTRHFAHLHKISRHYGAPEELFSARIRPVSRARASVYSAPPLRRRKIRSLLGPKKSSRTVMEFFFFFSFLRW